MEEWGTGPGVFSRFVQRWQRDAFLPALCNVNLIMYNAAVADMKKTVPTKVKHGVAALHQSLSPVSEKVTVTLFTSS